MKLTTTLSSLFALLAPLAISSAAGDVGVVAGRVVTDTGRPLSYASVALVKPGGLPSQSQSVSSDEEGRFRFDNVPPGSYHLEAKSAGYVPMNQVGPGADTALHRPGEVVELILTKGGVISGKIMDVNGQPAVQAMVWATSLQTGAADPFFFRSAGVGMTLTEDRGDYRIFGLAPGTYVVKAGGKFGASRMVTPHDNIVSSSYSQSRSGLPSPVEVSFGSEASGIDIQLRDLPGFIVSGAINGGPMESASAFVTLEDAGTGAVFQGVVASREEGQLVFSFENVPDGNYRLTARTEDRGQDVFASTPMNLRVHGRDVHGVSLSMLRLPNIDGQVILTKRPVPESEATCSTKSQFVMEEVVISAMRTVADEGRSVPNALPAVRIESVPRSNGDFTLRALPAGTYRLRTQLPDANWYVQSLAILPSAAGGLPLDAARNGLSVKPGQREFKLQVHLARGAAQLRGQVIAQLGDRLPGDVTVHLVPEESGQGENILRFLQTQVGNKGSFEILNIPPGRYWVLARSGFSKAERLGSTVAAWENLAGTQLLQEARAANQLLDLPVCRSIADYRLIYPPMAAGPSQGE